MVELVRALIAMFCAFGVVATLLFVGDAVYTWWLDRQAQRDELLQRRAATRAMLVRETRAQHERDVRAEAQRLVDRERQEDVEWRTIVDARDFSASGADDYRPWPPPRPRRSGVPSS